MLTAISDMNTKFRLVNIIGVDGAGKTTVAKELAKQLHQSDSRIKYKYCQYFAKLLLPVKYLAKVSVMRKTDEFEDYGKYNKTKQQTSSRYPRLANMYAAIWLVDYVIQVFFKITIDILFGKKLIIDRYIIDIAVNLSLTTNNNIDYAIGLIRYFFKFAPLPDLIVFIDLPEEVAFKRKNDIQDIEYLKERRARYLALADEYNFTIVNGDQSPDSVLNDVLKVVACNG